MIKLASALKVFLQIALFSVFLIFFGFPAIEKYQKKETITVSSKELTNAIEPPALTIVGISIKGLGWKTPQDGLDTWNSFKINEHCAELDMTTIEDCVENDTFHLTVVVKNAQFGKTFHVEISKKKHLKSSCDDMLLTSCIEIFHYDW